MTGLTPPPQPPPPTHSFHQPTVETRAGLWLVRSRMRNLLDVLRLAECKYPSAKSWKPERGVTATEKPPERRRSGSAKCKRCRQPPSFPHKDTFMCVSNDSTAERTWRHLLNESRTSLYCPLNHRWDTEITRKRTWKSFSDRTPTTHTHTHKHRDATEGSATSPRLPVICEIPRSVSLFRGVVCCETHPRPRSCVW